MAQIWQQQCCSNSTDYQSTYNSIAIHNLSPEVELNETK